MFSKRVHTPELSVPRTAYIKRFLFQNVVPDVVQKLFQKLRKSCVSSFQNLSKGAQFFTVYKDHAGRDVYQVPFVI